jgi:hypothetical protein
VVRTADAASVLGAEARADALEATFVVVGVYSLVAACEGAGESAHGEEGEDENRTEMHVC